MCVLLDRVVVSQDLHDFVAAYAHKRPSAAIQEILRRARATHTRDGRLDLAVQKGTQKIYMSLMAAPFYSLLLFSALSRECCFVASSASRRRLLLLRAHFCCSLLLLFRIFLLEI